MVTVGNSNFTFAPCNLCNHREWEYDVRIGSNYYHYCVSDGNECCFTRDFVVLKNPMEVKWEDLPSCVRRLHNMVDRNALEDMFFVDKRDDRKNLIYNKAVTAQIARELGRIEQVRYVRKVYLKHVTLYLYIVNNQCIIVQVARDSGEFCYKVVMKKQFDAIIERQQKFGRRATRFSKTLRIPWDITLCVGNIFDDEEAKKILKDLKELREYADFFKERFEGYEIDNLACKSGLFFLLGENLFSKLYISKMSFGRAANLAKYLLGDDYM